MNNNTTNTTDDEVDPFAPPPPPPSMQQEQHQQTPLAHELDEVLVEYSFRDFERFINITPKDMLDYQAGRKGFYDILYDKKTPCGEIYENMMSQIHNMAVETRKDFSVEDIKDSVIRKTFLECIDFHYHLYDVRSKNLASYIDTNSK